MEVNKNKIFMAIALVITIIAIGIGTTYAYYQISITSPTTQTISVGGATISVTYSNGADLTASNILPGWSGDKYFSVAEKNTSSKAISYNIQVYATTNTFGTSQGQLTGTLYSSATSGSFTSSALASDKALTATANTATTIHTKSVAANTNTTVYYKLTIKYPNNTSSVQAQGGSFAGYVRLTAGTTSITN